MIGFPPPFRVGLLITERCDAGCAHCWFDCVPENGVTMRRNDAQDYIDKASRLPSIEWISITGGEPMLHPSLVEGLIAYASGHGLKTELVTNCSWATTHDKSIGTLKRLRDAGLDALNISADDFHQDTIPFERVKYSYEAGKSLGIKMVLMTTLKKNSYLKIKEVSRLLGDELASPRSTDISAYSAIGIESGFIPVGRGALIPRDEWYLGGGSLTGGCDAVLRDIGVKPSGEVIPCCSASASLSGFVLGDLKDWDLEEMLADVWDRDFFKVLKEKGPMGLLKIQPKGIFVDKCHLCSEVLRSLL
jgi:hypothetical protein